MIKSVTIDPSKLLYLYIRVKRAGTKKFIFKNSAGTAVDVSSYNFELFIQRNYGAREKSISLTVGSGLAIGGAGNNELTATFTSTNTNLDEGEYFWELYKGSTEKTYLNGKAILHRGEFDGIENDEETIIIDDAGTDVVITVSESGQTAIAFKDEGNALGTSGTVNEIDFVGAGVSASRTGDKVTVTITASSLGFNPSRRIVHKNNISSSLTGTTAETKMDSVLIPGGTMQANDILFLSATGTKSGANAGFTIRLYTNTSDSLSGATLLATLTGSAGNLWIKMIRELVFKNAVNSQVIVVASSSLGSDLGGIGAASSVLAVDFSVNQYLIISLQMSSTADTGTVNSWYAETIRT